MSWLTWHYHIAGEPYKIKQKRLKRRQSVVAGRQQLYCAVGLQSPSPNHCQTTTGKLQPSARDGTLSAMSVHSWQITAGCSMHVPKPLGRHGRRALNIRWTVTSMAESAERRQRRKARWHCYMKAAVGPG